MPGVTLPVFDIVSVVEPEAPAMAFPGLKLAVAPAGTPLTVKVTSPLNPPSGAMYTTKLAFAPAVIV